MKKFFLILFLISSPTLALMAMDGDGSSSNPFRGILNNTEIWSIGEFSGNNVYIGTSSVPDLTITTDGNLTIDPGITVIFTQLTSDLIITGSGILTANGTNINRIIFTKDPGKSHWGHISFETPGSDIPISGSGSLRFCTFEYGYACTYGTTPDNMGGAIQVNAEDVIIENCIFQNNISTYGGAIAVGLNQNTIITNCYFLLNHANTGGGAILLRRGSSALVENSIFEENSCSGSYSGGAIWLNNNYSHVVNCTFINNSSDYSGDAVYSLGSSNSILLNSIFWGSDDQFAGINTLPTISFCAFQTNRPTVATNSITLNSSNLASDGPNFLDPSESDWRISFISPCRDAGTNSFSGITVPSTDYTDGPRIQTKDMGSFEVQYSYWTGASNNSWATTSNWESNITPSAGTGDVVIPSGLSTYPIDPYNPDFTIGTGNQMILQAGAKTTLGALTNNGTLRLESDASSISSLIISSFSGSGAIVEMYLSGGQAGSKNYRWHYISTPVSSLPVSIFTTVTPDIVRFYDSRVTTDLVQGWVAQDGWIYATGSYGGPTFSTLTPGIGYDYYDSNNNEFVFTGTLNTSDVQISLDHAGGPKNGFNLLGNPFPSGFDWDYIITHNYPASTSKSLFFTRDNALCSYIGGVGVPSDVTGIIPPMQGFFIKTYSSGNIITLSAAARTQSNIHQRYKGAETIPLIRLTLEDDTLSDETVIRFDEKASVDLDYDYDALKIFYSSENTGIYSVSEGNKYVINGQPFPDTIVSIPVAVNLLTSGVHTISTTQLQGLDSYGVYLKDNVTGFTANLKTNPVLTFTSSAGSFSDRFILTVNNFTTKIPEITTAPSLFNIYYGLGFVNIQPLSDEWDGIQGTVAVFDITGKKVNEFRDAEFVKNSIIRLPYSYSKGIYVVELKSGMKRCTVKVVIR